MPVTEKAADETRRRTARRRTLLVAVLCLFVALPAVIALGVRFDRGSFYLTSTAAIICVLVPFFVAFEGRRPPAHDLVVVAVLCALAVVGRAAFFWLPYVTAITAIVIIAAIALGPTAGFVVGALSLFLSNFLFAQGPWTPWQMFAYGLTGFVFGLLAARGHIPRTNLSRGQKIALSAGGFAFVVCITGPLLDTSSVFLMLNPLTPEGALAIYAAGLPVNIIHGVSTAAVLYVLANPLLGQLDRVRVKYGLME
jgi:energy-coupling factor transport system substrate-specific component